MLRRRHGRFLQLACLATVVGAGASGALAEGETFTAPIAGGADPWVTQWQGQYFYTRTTGGDVRLSRAPHLPDIVSNTQVLWNPPTDTAYGHNLWAPELHRVNDKWYMYVAADDGEDRNHRMYVLEGNSQDPMGTYTLKGQITPDRYEWAIDGTVFEHGDKDYFIWSGRTSTAGGGSQSLYIAEMSNPWTLTGERVRISSPQYAWERHGHPVNEGPQILRNDEGDVFLTYSASGFYVPDYALGLIELTGNDPLDAGSWNKHAQPVFQQGNGVTGTGHASFVKSPDGSEDWIVYHGRVEGDPARKLFMQPFDFGGDGLPDFGTPIAPGQPIAAPSGVPLVTYIPNGAFDRTDVTVNSDAGIATGIESFRTYGDVGVMSNNGRFFDRIEGGDGPQVAYLGNGNGGMWQDIGLIHAGTYTFSAGFALSSDQLAQATADPETFRFFIESVGVRPDGSLNEGDKTILASLDLSSTELNRDAFTYFDVLAIIPEDGDRIGSMLRLWIGRVDEKTATNWSVKIDNLSLSHSSAIPEPTSALSLLAPGVALLLRRHPSRRGHEVPTA